MNVTFCLQMAIFNTSRQDKMLRHSEKRMTGNVRKCTLEDRHISTVNSHVQCGKVKNISHQRRIHKVRGLMVQLLH